MHPYHNTPDQHLLRTIRLRILMITTLSFLLLFIGVQTAKSQSLGVSAFLENNIVGLQKGVEIGYVSRNNLKIAYFFQATEKISFEDNAYNYPFHGISLLAPIKQCDGLIFSAGMKTGFVNGKYLIMTPQVETELKLFGPLALGFTAGYRAGHAAIGSKLSVKI